MSEAQALSGIRVLLVDDDDDTREIIERGLARRGAEVVAVPSAPAALRRFAAQKPVDADELAYVVATLAGRGNA